MSDEFFARIAKIGVLGPDDKLIIVAKEGVSVEEGQRLTDTIEKLLPGRAVIFGGRVKDVYIAKGTGLASSQVVPDSEGSP